MLRPFEYMPPADYKLFLAAMRADRCLEYRLIGWKEVGRWLQRLQFTQLCLSEGTLRKWRKDFGMPVTQQPRAAVVCGGKRHPWTTNLMMSAWIGTQGRALTLPRWHPFRLSVQPRPLSQKPVAIRVRRHRDRRRMAAALASSSTSSTS